MYTALVEPDRVLTALVEPDRVLTALVEPDRVPVQYPRVEVAHRHRLQHTVYSCTGMTQKQ